MQEEESNAAETGEEAYKTPAGSSQSAELQGSLQQAAGTHRLPARPAGGAPCARR